MKYLKTYESFDFTIKNFDIYDKSHQIHVQRPSHMVMTWDEKYKDTPYKWKDYENGFDSMQDYFRKTLKDQFGENWLDDIMSMTHGKNWKEKLQKELGETNQP